MAKKNNVAKRSIELKEVVLDKVDNRLVLCSEDLMEPLDFNSVVEQFVGCVVDLSIVENVVILSNKEVRGSHNE